MARCIIKEKQGPVGIAFGEAFENVDCRINLHEEIIGTKVPISILAGLEDNPRLPEER